MKFAIPRDLSTMPMNDLEKLYAEFLKCNKRLEYKKVANKKLSKMLKEIPEVKKICL